MHTNRLSGHCINNKANKNDNLNANIMHKYRFGNSKLEYAYGRMAFFFESNFIAQSNDGM